MTSHTTAAGVNPAKRARSMLASVCPRRSSTPPALARRGKTWPGITISQGLLFGSASTLIVWARSKAEIPVETPCRASTDTVKFVPKPAPFRLEGTIMGTSSRSSISPARGVQINPRACCAMKFMASGVACCAAMTKSPSFSRSSSSTTITNLPASTSSIASFTVANLITSSLGTGPGHAGTDCRLLIDDCRFQVSLLGLRSHSPLWRSRLALSFLPVRGGSPAQI